MNDTDYDVALVGGTRLSNQERTLWIQFTKEAGECVVTFNGKSTTYATPSRFYVPSIRWEAVNGTGDQTMVWNVQNSF